MGPNHYQRGGGVVVGVWYSSAQICGTSQQILQSVMSILQGQLCEILERMTEGYLGISALMTVFLMGNGGFPKISGTILDVSRE